MRLHITSYYNTRAIKNTHVIISLRKPAIFRNCINLFFSISTREIYNNHVTQAAIVRFSTKYASNAQTLTYTCSGRTRASWRTRAGSAWGPPRTRRCPRSATSPSSARNPRRTRTGTCPSGSHKRRCCRFLKMNRRECISTKNLRHFRAGLNDVQLKSVKIAMAMTRIELLLTHYVTFIKTL